MGVGDASRSDAERLIAGPPLDSGRGPMWIAAASQALVIALCLRRCRRRDRGRQRAPRWRAYWQLHAPGIGLSGSPFDPS